LAEVLAQHLHHAAVRRDVVVDPNGLADEAALLHFEDAAEAIGIGLVGAEEAEVGGLGVLGVDVAHELADPLTRVFRPRLNAGARGSAGIPTSTLATVLPICTT